MLRRAIIAAATVVVTLLAPAVASAQAEVSLTVESVNGRDVSLLMTLPEPEGTYPADTPVNGTVTIGSRVLPAEVSLVQAEAGPDRAVLLVTDVSGSMAGAPMRAARAAAAAYLEQLPEDVATGLVTFADDVTVVTAPQSDRAVITEALARARADGDTSLYDAVEAALAEIPDEGIARLLVLSDGQDTISSATLGRVIADAQAVGVPVDMVLLDPTAEERAVADRLAGGTGGSVSTAVSADELVAAFEEAVSAFSTRVHLQATVPQDVSAAGAVVVATVSLAGEVVEDSTLLPNVASLAAVAGTVPGSAEEAPAVVLPPVSGTPWTAILLGAVVAVAGLMLLVAAVIHARRKTRRQRIDQVLAYTTGTSRVDPRGAPADGGGAWGRMERRFLRSGWGRRLQGRLTAAGYDMTPTRWVMTEVVSVLVLALLLGLLARSVVVGVLLAVPVGIMGFEAFLRSRVGRRQRAFEDELPDFLLMLSSALRAGLSFNQALESAADEQRGEVGRQMRRVLAETQVSSRLDEALLSCAERMDNDDLRWTVTAMSVQREVGGNLSQILDGAAATIKGRRSLAREVRTLSAEGRLSAYVLIALPLGVLTFLLLFRREYVSQLWTDPLGIAMLLVLVVLFTIGWFWMRAIVRIRV